jgi:hypothetical protein
MTTPNYRVKLDEATPEQLREYATIRCSLDIPDTATPLEIRSMILAQKPELQLIVLDGERPVTDGQNRNVRMERTAGRELVLPEDPSHPMNDPIVNVMISEPKENDEREICLIVGPHTWWCARGVQIALPYRAFLALSQAKTHTREKTGGVDPESGMDLYHFVERGTYGYAVDTANFPTPEQIRDFHNRTDHVKF